MIPLNKLSDEELEQYATEFYSTTPEYQKNKKYESIKDIYMKNIDDILSALSKLASKLNDIKIALDGKNLKEVYDKCDRVAVDSEKIVQSIRRLPVEFGMKDGYEKIKTMITDAADIKFEYLSHNILHITFPNLLPPRPGYDAGSKKITHKVDYDYLRSSYIGAFNKEFSKGKHRIHTKQVALVYINYFASDNVLKDHDNLDPKIITDIITQYLLIDDNPKWVSQYMDYGYSEYTHTEAYVVPMEIFPNFLVTLNKQIKK